MGRATPALWLVCWLLLSAFDLSRHAVPPDEIVSGGPPKDGIPAIDRPRFVPAAAADFLRPTDEVLGVALGGEAKAYPLRILNWHEAVNDQVGGRPILVTYCPLTTSGAAYDRKIGGKVLEFGISGRLYQSNVLLYDRATETLWSQLREGAVAGPLTGERLRPLPLVRTTWADWRQLHPDTLVLSPETGFRRNYEVDPYAPYHRSPVVAFPVHPLDRRLPAKTKVYGLSLGGASKAYPLERLASVREVSDTVGSRSVRIQFAPASGRVVARSADGTLLPGVVAYWFAWAAFHPGTAVWAPPERRPTPVPSRRGEVPGTALETREVRILSHEGYWTSLLGIGLGAGMLAPTLPGLFVVHGRLRNVTDRTLDHVKLRFELLDAAGRVVAREDGFNRASESLRPLDSPFHVRATAGEVRRPLAPGAEDSFRMLFLRDETPPFVSYRIRVIGQEAPEPSPR